MFRYYTIITAISALALAVLCVLVHENGRFKKEQKPIFYLTYLFIISASAAEWAGIFLNGNDATPQWLLLAVKCADYTLTPVAGGALIRQVGIRNKGVTVLNCVLVGNTVFQILSAFFGWMTTIAPDHTYRHGPLYFIYVIVYLAVIAIIIVEFIIYGKGFAKQNRFSLYSVMVLILGGIALQEILGGEYRTAYFSLTLGALLMFIHYVGFAQLAAEDRIKAQRELLLKDSMTGLFSRYAYSKALIDYDIQGKLPNDLVVFSIDINGLKAANDSLGHVAGDELIIGAAECIDKVFGSIGQCYRTGGDEFIVLARFDAEKPESLIKKLTEETDKWSGKINHNLSVSAGYALAKEHEGVSAEKLIVFADQGMYDDKRNYYRRFENFRRVYAFDDN